MVADFIFSPSLAALGIGGILRRWPKLRGTTLVAPAGWTIAVFALMAIVDTAIAWQSWQESAAEWVSSMRFTLGIATLCPFIALLGAKRPQHIAWQFIVFTLWFVLSLPSARELLFGGGASPSLHPAQSWFVAILIIMTTANHLPTRFCLASVMVSTGQTLLLYDLLPLSQAWPAGMKLQQVSSTVSLALFVAAVGLVCIGWPCRRLAKLPLDRVWLDFRDAFGAVWSLRVQQRLNQSATMYGWNVRLDWHGFTPLDGGAIPPPTEKAIRDNLSNVLRRFVSSEWIAERLGRSAN